MSVQITSFANATKVFRGFRKIGPRYQLLKSEPLTMQSAIDTDCETGVRWMNEQLGKELMDKFPTIVAMAGLIEQERDKYKKETVRLKRTISRMQQQTTERTV